MTFSSWAAVVVVAAAAPSGGKTPARCMATTLSAVSPGETPRGGQCFAHRAGSASCRSVAVVVRIHDAIA
jgi:hypothetical protein